MVDFWIILIIVFSSLIKGVTGFGFALFSFPLLLIWFEPKEIVPVLMICNLIASIFITLQKKEHRLLDKKSYLLIGAGSAFTILGVIALSSINGKLLVHLSGLLFLLLTLFSLRKRKPRQRELPNHVYLWAGSLVGFITGAVSVSGPPLALFLRSANVSNRKFREIFAWFSVITAVIAILGYAQAGLITAQTLKLSVVCTPILLAGTIVGKKLNSNLSLDRFQTINMVLTLIASILLIIN